MAINPVQALKYVPNTVTSANQLAISLDAPATAGNLIVVGGYVDKQTTITDPTDFTSRINTPNTSLSYMLATKRAVGGEQNITATLGDSTQNAYRAFIMELPANAEVDKVIAAYSGETIVTSQGAGPTAALATDAAEAYAFWGADSPGGVAAGTGHAFSNGYALAHSDFTDPTSSSGIPAIAVGHKVGGLNASGESTTFSYTGGTGDQSAVMLIVFRDTTAGGGGSTPAILDIDTDESVTGSQTGVILTTQNAGDTQGTGAVHLVSGATVVPLAVSSWSAIAIAVNMALSSLKYTDATTTHSIRLTTNDGQQASLPVTVTPPSGYNVVTLTLPQNTGPGSITAAGNFTGTFVDGTQIEFQTSNGFNILPDGTCSATVSSGTWNCRANDGTGWQAFTVTLSSSGGGGGDVTAPDIVGSIAVTSVTQTTATVTATPNESGNYGLAIVVSSASTPAAANILAGNVSGAAFSRASTAMTANTQISVALSGLSAGFTYKPAFAFTDANGNTRVVVGANFTMQTASGGDTTPPTVSLAVASAAPLHTFTAAPSDNVGVAGVQFLVNGSPYGSEVTAAPWTMQWSEGGMPAGTYMFTARARDAAGNTTDSNSLQIVVGSSGSSASPLASGGPGVFEPRANVWRRIQDR